MKNKIIYALLGLLVIVATGLYIKGNMAKKISAEDIVVASPKNATYIIDGHPVTLVDGFSSVLIATDSTSKITTQYFGNEVSYDFDKDGRPDVAFIITQNTGGSGTFYYAAVALNTVNGYVGSDAVLLGDRIAPQTTEMSQNPATPDVIVVNYADRKPEDSFVVPPSVGKSMWLKLDTKTMHLSEIGQNSKQEVNQSSMSLGMKTWTWVHTTYNNDTTVTPRTNKFTLTLKASKIFSASTDCNGVGGEYTLDGNKITFVRMMSTMMYCEGSQEGDYSKMLSQVQSYTFDSKGELVLSLNYDSGSMIFK